MKLFLIFAEMCLKRERKNEKRHISKAIITSGSQVQYQTVVSPPALPPMMNLARANPEIG